MSTPIDPTHDLERKPMVGFVWIDRRVHLLRIRELATAGGEVDGAYAEGIALCRIEARTGLKILRTTDELSDASRAGQVCSICIDRALRMNAHAAFATPGVDEDITLPEETGRERHRRH